MKQLISRLNRFFLLNIALAVIVTSGQPLVSHATHSQPERETLGPLPLAFVPNAGQRPSGIEFEAISRWGAVAFSAGEVTLVANEDVLRVQFLGANAEAHITSHQQLPGVVNYYTGADPARWRDNLPTYGEVVYDELYDGIDLTYNGHEGALKGTYTLEPGVSPDRIHWRYTGAENVTVDSATGDLHIDLGATRLIERAPIAWQSRSGVDVPIGVRFAARPDGSFGFALDRYDPALPLVIDPTLIYGTYLGAGSTDNARDVAVDGNGNVYLTGLTYSSNFPGTTGPRSGWTDVFVTKLNAQGTALLYTTILGGGDDETGHSIVVNATGQAWITGETESINFPTLNPLRIADFSLGYLDTFATKLNANGSLAFSTYLNFDVNDQGFAIALDGQGNAYITGEASAQFGPQVVVHKLAADGSAVQYTRLFGAAERGFDKGSSGHAIAVDSDGNAYITGRTNSIVFPVVNAFQAACSEDDGFDCTGDDAFVAKINATGDTLVYSTYLGGSSAGSETGTGSDEGWGIAVDAQGSIYVAGQTFAPDFPVTNAFQATKAGLDNFTDGFVAKFTPAGDALEYATYLGGEAWEEIRGLVIDGAGNAYVAGFTSSDNFPVPTDALQPQIGAGICFVGSTERFCYDGFVAAFDATGSRVWSTYLGGNDDDIVNGLAYAGQGLYVAGKTDSFDMPMTTGVFQRNKALNTDAFVVKIGTSGATPPPLPYRVYLPMLVR